MGSLAFQNGIRDVLYTRYWFTLCDECTYLGKGSWRRSITHRRWMSLFSRQCRLRLNGSTVLRLEPVLISFETDGHSKLPTTRNENEFEIVDMSRCVTLCSSNNELVWSNGLFARESLQILEWTQEQSEIHCRDPSHNCPTAETRRYHHSATVVLSCWLSFVRVTEGQGWY